MSRSSRLPTESKDQFRMADARRRPAARSTSRRTSRAAAVRCEPIALENVDIEVGRASLDAARDHPADARALGKLGASTPGVRAWP